jgi:hypothetical protein
MTAHGGPATIKSMKIWAMKSIWPEKSGAPTSINGTRPAPAR